MSIVCDPPRCPSDGCRVQNVDKRVNGIAAPNAQDWDHAYDDLVIFLYPGNPYDGRIPRASPRGRCHQIRRGLSSNLTRMGIRVSNPGQ